MPGPYDRPGGFNAAGELPRVTGIERITISISGSAPKNIAGLLMATLREHGVVATTIEVATPNGERTA